MPRTPRPACPIATLRAALVVVAMELDSHAVKFAGLAEEIRRDYVTFIRKTDKELLAQFGYGAPGDTGEMIRSAAVENLVAAYARVTGLSLEKSKAALEQYEAESRPG